MTTATIEERVSRLEGAYDHLATKNDLSQLETRLAREISNLTKWMIGSQIAVILAIVAILKLMES